MLIKRSAGFRISRSFVGFLLDFMSFAMSLKPCFVWMYEYFVGFSDKSGGVKGWIEGVIRLNVGMPVRLQHV